MNIIKDKLLKTSNKINLSNYYFRHKQNQEKIHTDEFSIFIKKKYLPVNFPTKNIF